MPSQNAKTYDKPTWPNGNINWLGWGRYRVREILRELDRNGEKTSIRGMWYILVSKFPKIIPNIHSRYSSYDNSMVEARAYGFIDEDAFLDTTRRILDIDDDNYTDETDQTDAAIKDLKETAISYYIPRHYNQPNYQEIWLEKDAIARFVDNIVNNGKVSRQIRIVPNRGWTSMTYVKRNINRLKHMWTREYVTDIWIWYGGDLDPSGARMFVNLKEEIMNSFREWFLGDSKEVEDKLSHIHVEQFAVLKEQIQTFNLEHLQNPDPETKFKLEGGIGPDGKSKKGDSNTEWFKRVFGDGRVFQIEIDAMQARRQQFKGHLLHLIDSHFDKSIYKRDVKDALEPAQDSIRTLLKHKVSNLEDDWVD